MRKYIQYYRKILMMIALISMACLLQGCPMSKREQSFALTGATLGTWEWVQTVTPTRTFTPQSVGYTKQLSVATDLAGAYIAFYRNDTLQRRANETPTDTTHTFVDGTRQTVTTKYGGAGFIKYTIISGNTLLTISEFLPNSYSTDTVKSTYKKERLLLYPY